MIYARKRTWLSIEDLSEDLRIEPESFKNSDKELLASFIKNYPIPRVKKPLYVLQKDLKL